MWITIYLFGVCISAGTWFGLVKIRQRGFGVRMPDAFDGWLLEPIGKNVDYEALMRGWFLMAVLWPMAWGFLISAYFVAWVVQLVILVWQNTLGNEELAKKIFRGHE